MKNLKLYEEFNQIPDIEVLDAYEVNSIEGATECVKYLDEKYNNESITSNIDILIDDMKIIFELESNKNPVIVVSKMKYKDDNSLRLDWGLLEDLEISNDVNIKDWFTEKANENVSYDSDNNMVEHIKSIGERLIKKGIIEHELDTPIYKNEGANGYTLTFIDDEGQKSKLYFFFYTFNDLGLCINDINNSKKTFYPNGSYGYDVPKIPVRTISDEKYPDYLVRK